MELSSQCNMSCGYCLDPETPVLTSDLVWRPIGSLSAGDKVLSFDEFAPDDGKKTTRRMRLAEVERVWDTEKETIRIVTNKGDVVCSLNHKFLMKSGGRWREAGRIRPGQLIQFAAEPWQPADIEGLDYIRGYLVAMTIGDGTVRWNKSDGASGQSWWRVAVTDKEILDRIDAYFKIIGIEHPGIRPFPKTKEHYKDVNKLEIRKKSDLEKLHSFLYAEDQLDVGAFELGYLAGIFDAEGTALHGVIRISQKNPNDVCEKTMTYLGRLGFDSVREKDGVRLRGGRWEILRFFGTTQPAVNRQRDTWVDHGVYHDSAEVLSVESLGLRRLIDIQTTTRTFYGAGFATHNCYHADQVHLPFKKGMMPLDIGWEIIKQAAELGVNALKFNWKGESTINPYFYRLTAYAKKLANGSVFIDRLTNSNFKFMTSKDEIFDGLCNQTKVKVSYDSFNQEVFETQRKGGDWNITTRNIDKFYNYKKRKNTKLVIQAVRTILNKDEDIAHEANKRWPEASLSIRDMVGGRVEKDLSELENKKRDISERQSCLQAHVRIIFNHEGNAFLCCPDIKEELCVGDIRTHSLREIFNSEKARLIRKQLKTKEAFDSNPCKNCSSFETYKGFKPVWDS